MSKPQSTRSPLSVAGTTAARVAGGLGLFACVLCCVSVPSVVAALSALGLGFLRNDRLLQPVEVICVALVLFAFVRSRSRHGHNAPILLGPMATAVLLWGLATSGATATVAAMFGSAALLAVLVWDARLQRRCAT